MLVCSDNSLERMGIRRLLQADDWQVDEVPALDASRTASTVPAAAIVSLTSSGPVDDLREFLANAPETPIIGLVSESRNYSQLLSAGLKGLLLQRNCQEQLLDALTAVLAGKVFIDRELTGIEQSPLSQSVENGHAEFAFIRSKMHRPTPPPDYVARDHLIRQLEQHKTVPLTLLSAPAGFGKSVLASTWLDTCEWPSSWISLDESDSTLRSFVLYFIEALRKIHPVACQPTRGLVLTPDLPSMDRLVISLSNDIDDLATPFLLVLDDYHRIQADSPVHELIERLLQHPPIPLHIVILTRHDPPLSLSTLRASGQIFELRMNQLTFSRASADDLLERISGMALAESNLAELHRSLEGWPVGLRLVGLALQQASKPETILGNLQRPESTVQEYLLEELLKGETPETRRWLLETSVLDRFNGPVCDAVCQPASDDDDALTGSRFLREAFKHGLFLIPLDEQQEWYRYHHTFQSLLQEQLEDSEGVDALHASHRRASFWFETNGHISEAITHALKAGDSQLAARIVENNQWDVINEHRWSLVDNWLDQLPAETVSSHPELLCARGWTCGLGSRAEEQVQIIAQLEALPPDLLTPGVQRHLISLKTYMWIARGEYEDARKLMEETLANIPSDASGLLGSDVICLCWAYMASGRSAAAISFAEETIRKVDASRRHFHALSIPALMHLYLNYGEHQLLRALVTPDNLSLPGFLGRGVYREGTSYLVTWELNKAERCFETARANAHFIRGHAELDLMAGRVMTSLFLGRQPEADLAFRQFTEFATDRRDDWSSCVLNSLTARRAVHEGQFDEALDWALAYDAPVAGVEPLVFVESPSLTRGKVLTSLEDRSLVQAGLEHLLNLEPHLACSTHHTIALHVLLAAAYHRLDQVAESKVALSRALTLAAPGGSKLPFLEAGQIMLEMLSGIPSDEPNRLFLLSIKKDLERSESRSTPSRNPQVPEEPLTNRELDILVLVAERLRNKEIAARLFVSSETVKTHLKNVYRKLGVSNRSEARERAAEILSDRA